jgi:WD40 repeat protein
MNFYIFVFTLSGSGKSIMTLQGYVQECIYLFIIIFHYLFYVTCIMYIKHYLYIFLPILFLSLFLLLHRHASQLLALDFSPNGWHLASGGDDNTCIIHELRQQRTLYTIPAHRSLIKSLKYSPISGEILVTASFDSTLRIWNGRDFSPLATLKGHENKVSAVAIAENVQWMQQLRNNLYGNINNMTSSTSNIAIVSASFDRTVKIWG